MRKDGLLLEKQLPRGGLNYTFEGEVRRDQRIEIGADRAMEVSYSSHA